MVPSRKGKGKETAGSEAESSERHVRGRNAYIALSADRAIRPVLRMTGYRTFDAGRPDQTQQVNKIISQTIRNNYPDPFSKYIDFPKATQSFIKAELLKHYQFAEEVVENEAWDTFRWIVDKRLQDMLNKAKGAARKVC